MAPSFPPVENCDSTARDKQSLVSELNGTLLRSRSSFPYFMLVAFETGGVLRAAGLILVAPLALVLYHFVSESAGIQVLIFASYAGVRVADIESVARAVLPKFYSEDLHPETWRVFSSFGKRCVLTEDPRIMVEPFLREYLGVDIVIGTEIGVVRGRATGFVKKPGVLVGDKKRNAMEEAFGNEKPDVGLGDRKTDYPYMALCKEAYLVPASPKVEAVRKKKLPKQIVFHDGRLVARPTPLVALVTLLWIPIGFVLALVRIAAGTLLPMKIVYYISWSLGVRFIVRGNPPADVKDSGMLGVLFVCSHRSLLDPIFLCAALGRPVTAVTYSLSRLSEIISPIRTVRLTRDREKDAAKIREVLEEGDLVICPEGTTCREPFLLRFSALFADLTDHIVPVAIANRMSMFHGTTARGWKGLDSFFFLMNPSPVYEVTFLNRLPHELTCGGGKTSHEVANYVQRVLADSLGFECTTLTRKDKYTVLAGNDGSVPNNPRLPNKMGGC